MCESEVCTKILRETIVKMDFFKDTVMGFWTWFVCVRMQSRDGHV